MNRRRWYYKNGTCFEEFDILFDNGRFMLVQNVETKVRRPCPRCVTGSVS